MTLIVVVWMLLVVIQAATAYVPVIGIAAEPIAGNDKPALEPLGSSLLAASYVKWIESAGARVVPLQFDLPQSQLRELYSQINGILLPGGGSSINDNSTYARFSRQLFEWAVEDKLPVWGTCLGFEQLMVYSSDAAAATGTGSVLEEFDSESLFLPLGFTPAAATSRILRSAPARVIATLGQQNVTANLHRSGISPSVMASNSKLNHTWRVLATNVDRKGKPFVSLAEGISLPLFASQFHPEKNAFEFDQTWDTPEVARPLHSVDAIEAAAWLGRAFVNAAQQNPRRFRDKDAFNNASIWNYNPLYTAAIFPAADLWEQTYVFGSMS
jgi:gamma-glutamyl hydrolase